jgi:hypothetical protein
MGWTWRCEAGDGRVAAAEQMIDFPSKSDAESWIGEEWRALRAAGVRRAYLLEDGRVEYGPLALEPDPAEDRGDA